jgi:hypothetical protein
MLRSKTALAVLVVAAGCGSSKKASPTGSTGSGSPNALSAEAQSAVTGDIPDNQVFLTFHNAAARY